ncbi:hypothetical protein [Aurantimonas sp. VKM B-3413]|uniref:hypothetical protein n=1 Tax=Aurantimonas sp. VKM B-3413 TaxID=2779401 RepID=UPI001E3FE765|nr:hypothetical protein [Aurantimonas sp. VKM B-3413]MCB8837772.1 hypothetical protein [Aurantimonas sp. VKM B-3413]
MSICWRDLWATAALAVIAFGGAVHPAAAQPEDPAEIAREQGVEVSLGDWAVKTQLASDLSRKISDIPLTVRVPEDVAAEVCPLGSDDLAQQATVNPTRTCAAKSLTDALKEAVRRSLDGD